MITCKNRPLYCRNENDSKAYEAYIEMTENGKIVTDCSPNDAGTPMHIYNGLGLRWSIDPNLTAGEINALLEEVEPLINILYKDSEIKWDGRNYRRDYNEELEIMIINLCEKTKTWVHDGCEDYSCIYCYDHLSTDEDR